jgi:hypothetical protein
MLLGLVILSIALLDELVSVLRGGVPSYESKGEKLLRDKDGTTAELNVAGEL